jgi:hypothetical protein
MTALRRWDRETALVATLATLVSVGSFVLYFRRGDLLLYGDAVAHINIARRVFDSRTPGLLQLGTVWLPLPHLLMIPFLLSHSLWQSGLGGSIPSLVAYVLGTVGIFRLVRGALGVQEAPNLTIRTAAWTAAVIYAANPNLIYLQTTAMTESLYLALFIWAIVYFCEFAQAVPAEGISAAKSSLVKCGLCLAGACLTRYDGWFLGVVLCAVALLIGWKASRWRGVFSPGIRNFVLIAAAAPVLWLAYNAIVYRNPLEFANGPYSAKGIERKTAIANYPPHPGSNNLPEAATFFLKSGELNLLQSNWHRLWLALALLGTATVLLFDRRVWPLLLLWTPLPFYMLSIAYGGVPIFLPPWWPHSMYNARYGVQLLPVFAVFVALVAYWLMEFFRGLRPRAIAIAATAMLVFVSYALVWREGPISYQEAWVNSRTRIALEKELAGYLAQLPPDSSILMYLGDHVGALERAGIPLRRTIYEGNHRTWMQPSDPDGLWERALASPAKYADFVVAMDGDAVALGVNKQQLSSLAILHVTGQPLTTIYRVRKADQ